jgi:hypothetical protein
VEDGASEGDPAKRNARRSSRYWTARDRLEGRTLNRLRATRFDRVRQDSSFRVPLGNLVAEAGRIAPTSGLPNETNAMFKIVEGEYEDGIAVIKTYVDTMA